METELQFLFRDEPPLVVPIALGDLDLRRSQAFDMVDTYYDTPSLDLRRQGCSLRVRQSGEVVRPRLTLKGPSKRRGGAKRRYEAETPIEQLPDEILDMRALLARQGLLRELHRISGLAEVEGIVAIGVLRCRRSEHRYEHGLHRLDLTWDRLEFPTGPPQTRLEVEARSPSAELLLSRAAEELESIFGSRLRPPDRGKTRELCERLYPLLLAA